MVQQIAATGCRCLGCRLQSTVGIVCKIVWLSVLQSALTHSKPTGRDSLEVTWSAANASGQVRFVATVVEDYRTWWENVRSEAITVTMTNSIRAAPLQVAHSYTAVYIHTVVRLCARLIITRWV